VSRVRESERKQSQVWMIYFEVRAIALHPRLHYNEGFQYNSIWYDHFSTRFHKNELTCKSSHSVQQHLTTMNSQIRLRLQPL